MTNLMSTFNIITVVLGAILGLVGLENLNRYTIEFSNPELVISAFVIIIISF